MKIINQSFVDWFKSSLMKQDFLAKECNVSKQSVSNWNTGRSIPIKKTQKIIAKLSKNKVPVSSWSRGKDDLSLKVK